MSVYLPSPRDNGTYPLSKARVVFYANPGKMPTPENGTYTSIARFKAGDLNAVETLFILNDGAANEQAQPGQGTRYISFTSTNTKTMFNFRNGQRDSVEVQIRGYAKADGRMIPVGTFGSAYSNGSIATTQYSLR